MSISLYTTGGTFDKFYYDAKDDFHIGIPQAPRILKRVNVTAEVHCTELLRKDSLEMTDDDRAHITQAIVQDPSSQIILTHGTDTMIDTAKALQDIRNKTIVLTGAMLPAICRDSDAEFNLGCAITAVQTLPTGIYIVMNGQVFDPLKAHKNIAKKLFEAL